MNKVRCKNNHFFDLDKFSVCPICGSGVGTNSQKKDTGNSGPSSIRNSLLVKKEDKTAILNEAETSAANPVKGRAGGIIWNFQSQKQNTTKPDTGNVQDIDETQMQTVEDIPQTVPQSQILSAQNSPAAVRPEGQGTDITSLKMAVANTEHGMTSALPKTVAYYEQFTEIVPPTGWLVCIKGAHKGQAFQCKENKNKIGRNEAYTIAPMEELSISREVHATLYFDPKYRKFYLHDGDGDGLVRVNDELLCGKTELKAYDRIELGKAEFVFLPLCGEHFSWDDYKE